MSKHRNPSAFSDRHEYACENLNASEAAELSAIFKRHGLKVQRLAMGRASPLMKVVVTYRTRDAMPREPFALAWAEYQAWIAAHPQSLEARLRALPGNGTRNPSSGAKQRAHGVRAGSGYAYGWHPATAEQSRGSRHALLTQGLENIRAGAKRRKAAGERIGGLKTSHRDYLKSTRTARPLLPNPAPRIRIEKQGRAWCWWVDGLDQQYGGMCRTKAAAESDARAFVASRSRERNPAPRFQTGQLSLAESAERNRQYHAAKDAIHGRYRDAITAAKGLPWEEHIAAINRAVNAESRAMRQLNHAWEAAGCIVTRSRK